MTSMGTQVGFSEIRIYRIGTMQRIVLGMLDQVRNDGAAQPCPYGLRIKSVMTVLMAEMPRGVPCPVDSPLRGNDCACRFISGLRVKSAMAGVAYLCHPVDSRL